MLFFNFFKKLDLVVLRLFNLHDCRFLHRNTAVLVITELNDHGIIGHINDHTVKTAGSKNGISYSNAA